MKNIEKQYNTKIDFLEVQEDEYYICFTIYIIQYGCFNLLLWIQDHTGLIVTNTNYIYTATRYIITAIQCIIYIITTICLKRLQNNTKIQYNLVYIVRSIFFIQKIYILSFVRDYNSKQNITVQLLYGTVLFIISGLHMYYCLITWQFMSLLYILSIATYNANDNNTTTNKYFKLVYTIKYNNMNVYNILQTLFLILCFTIIIIFMNIFINKQQYNKYIQYCKLKSEKEYTNILLSCLLPEYMAKRLIIERNTINFSLSDIEANPILYNLPIIAEIFPSCSIQFCEIKNFDTQIYNKKPEEFIYILNIIFNMFDNLLKRYNVYKVETIDHIYMVSSGIPYKTKYHTFYITCLAQEMYNGFKLLSKILQIDDKVSIRIGLDTGRAVGGIIGIKLPRYRILGDIVNTASRMQVTALDNTIQITKMFYACISQYKLFLCKPRGCVHIKGKGKMYTYIVCDMILERYSPIFNCTDYFNVECITPRLTPPVDDIVDDQPNIARSSLLDFFFGSLYVSR